MDANRRLLRIESPQGTTKTSFTYDTAPNPQMPTSYASGRMTSAANDGYTWHFGYDLMGRVNKQTLQTPSNGYIAASYGYTTTGWLQTLIYPGTAASSPGSVVAGRSYGYSYDLLGRPLSLAWYDPGTATSNYRAQNAQYNAAGQLTSWQEDSATAMPDGLTR